MCENGRTREILLLLRLPFLISQMRLATTPLEADYGVADNHDFNSRKITTKFLDNRKTVTR
jgi:hypothetical protein